MTVRRDRLSKTNLILAALGLIPVTWFALLAAPTVGGGLPSIVRELPKALEQPFNIRICAGSTKTVLIFVIGYAFALMLYFTSDRNFRRREEHGSAEWGTAESINKRYRDPDSFNNKILTNNVAISLNARKHLRNLNTVVVGGSGAGKTRYFAKPNILQANSSYIILDPKGELLRDTGNLLKEKGYVIKVFNLIDTMNSDCYNPFDYIRSDDDITKLVTNLFKNTTPKNASSQDPFWDNSAQMLLAALIFYLYHKAPKEEQNFQMVMEMLRAGDVSEDDPTFRSQLDQLFDRLEAKEPDHIACRYYRNYRSGSGKTLKSIQITLLSHLSKFNLDSITRITSIDEMELDKMGDRKTALYAIIPNNDTSFNFLIGMLYTQLFQQLDDKADTFYHGGLKVPVHFVMDEFANVALPDEFDIELATMRARNISVSIILQNMAQLEALFEKQHKSIVGNCDTFLYLGGNELSTHEYITKLLGKETIDLNTYGESHGRNGNYSTNLQITGRELMTPDEVRRLDNRYAILFIRGERPILDLKYDLNKHPNIRFTTDGGAAPMILDRDLGIASAFITEAEDENDEGGVELDINEEDYLIISAEEIDEYLSGNKKPNETKKSEENANEESNP